MADIPKLCIGSYYANGRYRYLYIEGSEPDWAHDCDHPGAEYPAICQICHGTGITGRVKHYEGTLAGEGIPINLIGLFAEAPRMLELLERLYFSGTFVSDMEVLHIIRRAYGWCWRCGHPPERHSVLCQEDPAYQVKRIEGTSPHLRCGVCGLLHYMPLPQGLSLIHSCRMPRCAWCNELVSNVGQTVHRFGGRPFCSVECLDDWRNERA